MSFVALVTDEYVTQVIRLENISAAKLIPVLRPLVPQQAHMAAYAPSNAIIISDVSANERPAMRLGETPRYRIFFLVDRLATVKTVDGFTNNFIFPV